MPPVGWKTHEEMLGRALNYHLVNCISSFYIFNVPFCPHQ